MIGKDDQCGCIGLKDNMIVLAMTRFGMRCLMGIDPKFAALSLGIDRHAPAHTQMNDKRLIAVEVRQQIFCPPP